MINWTYATKTVVSVLTSVSVYLSTPNMGWKEAVTLGIGSVLVWLVPNTTNPAKPAPILSAPITNMERAELESLRASQKVIK
jgi:hypothetical protein